jgi:hypothetical protein
MAGDACPEVDEEANKSAQEAGRLFMRAVQPILATAAPDQDMTRARFAHELMLTAVYERIARIARLDLCGSDHA